MLPHKVHITTLHLLLSNTLRSKCVGQPSILQACRSSSAISQGYWLGWRCKASKESISYGLILKGSVDNWMPVLLLFKKSGQKRIREPPQNLLLESSLPTKQANCVLLLCDVCLSLSSSPLPQPTPMQVSAHPCLSELIGALHASSYNCLPPANTHTHTHTH